MDFYLVCMSRPSTIRHPLLRIAVGGSAAKAPDAGPCQNCGWPGLPVTWATYPCSQLDKNPEKTFEPRPPESLAQLLRARGLPKLHMA